MNETIATKEIETRSYKPAYPTTLVGNAIRIFLLISSGERYTFHFMCSYEKVSFVKSGDLSGKLTALSQRIHLFGKFSLSGMSKSSIVLKPHLLKYC